jgi:basic membrane protein A
MGIKDGAVGWARDANNAALITPAIEAKVAAARDAIVNGAQSVVDYTTANSCPL